MAHQAQLGKLGFARQTAKGSAATLTQAAPTRWMKLRSSSVGPDRSLLIPDPEIAGTGGRDVPKPYLGPASFSGDYEFYVRSEALPLALYGVLGGGGAVPTGSGAAGYTHVFTPADTLPFFTLEERVGNTFEVFKYTDAQFNSLHLEVAPDGYMQGTVGVAALALLTGTAGTVPAFDATPLYVGSQVTVTLNSVQLAASAMSLDITNNIESDHFVLGSLFPDDLTPKRRDVTGSFTLRPGNSDLFRQATLGSPTATAPTGQVTVQGLTITATTYEIISGATTQVYSTSLTLPEVVLAPFKVEASGDNTIEHSIDWRATKIATSNIVTATVINGIATAYSA